MESNLQSIEANGPLHLPTKKHDEVKDEEYKEVIFNEETP